MKIWPHTTSLGYGYFRMDDYDIQLICEKCQKANGEDIVPLDCDSCALPILVSTIQEYAEQLDDLESSGII